MPKARPVGDDPVFWQNARANGLGNWLEHDLYEYIDTLVKGFVDTANVGLLENLLQTASWGKQILSAREFCTDSRLNYKPMDSKWCARACTSN